jgi:hypothetical protein
MQVDITAALLPCSFGGLGNAHLNLLKVVVSHRMEMKALASAHRGSFPRAAGQH